MTENCIHVERLSRKFGANIVFDNCALKVRPGSIYGLVGRNGAGKTTLIRLLLGLLKPDGGEVSVLGCTPWEHREEFYMKLGVVLENDGMAPNMTLKDNLRVFAAAKEIPWGEAEAYIREWWKDTFIFEELRQGRKKVKYFSRGQRMQCGLCRAFLGRPRLLLLDEPTVALDVDAYDHLCKLIAGARGEGAAALISSHQLSAIEDLCDAVGILDNRRVHAVKSSEDVHGPEQWVLATDGAGECGEILAVYSKTPPVYREGAWHFALGAPETEVPELIDRLVGAGCRIREVRPEKRFLKDLMRAHYEKNEGNPR